MTDIPTNPTTPVTNGAIVTTANPLPVYLVGGIPATDITVGTTKVDSGTTQQLLYDNAGVLGEITKANSSVLISSGAGVPSWSTTLPSGLTLPSPTMSGTTQFNGPINVANSQGFTVGSGGIVITSSVGLNQNAAGVSVAGAGQLGFVPSTNVTVANDTYWTRAGVGIMALPSGQTLQLGAAYAAGVVVATGTIAIKDSSGTTYNMLVHT